MKKTTIIIFFLITNLAFACSCDYDGNFIYSSLFSPVIIKGKVVKRFYNFTDEKKINSTNKKEFKDYLILTNQQFIESIQVEIIELIKGVENRKIIEIYGGDGVDCRAGVYEFTIGNIFIFLLNYTTYSYSDMPNENNNDFILRDCSETYIEFIPETNKVRGLIKGKSFRKRIRDYSYNKLIEKIS
jgi:hypothetical protein